jgi:hypothetical protein
VANAKDWTCGLLRIAPRGSLFRYVTPQEMLGPTSLTKSLIRDVKIVDQWRSRCKGQTDLIGPKNGEGRRSRRWIDSSK